MNDILRAALLGGIQGVTEFLPISSSGHLLLVRRLLGWDGFSLFFDILLHCATLVVIVWYFRTRLWALMRRATAEEGRLLFSLTITTVVTGVLGLLISRYIPLDSLVLTAYCYGFTAFLVAITALRARVQGDTLRAPSAVSWKVAVVIGLFQGVAVLPGMSRAGATIMIARLCGVERERAFEYSFLASIPAILGALLLQLVSDTAVFDVSALALLIGGAVAAASGYLSLRILRYLNLNARMALFIPYLLFLTIVFFIL